MSADGARPAVGYFAEKGAALLANEYLILPIKKGAKNPDIAKGWQDLRLTAADLGKYPGCGLGILTGTGEHPIAAIDVDCLDANLSARYSAWLTQRFGATVERVGNAPKILFVYRAAEPGWGKATGAWLEDLAGGRHRLEVLGKGQQFVAYAIHPDTNRPYEWVDPLGGLEGMHAAELPVITLDDVAEAVAMFETMALEAGLSKVVGSSSRVRTATVGADDPDDPLMAVQPVGFTLAECRGFLQCLSDNNDRDHWLQTGMELHHEFGGEEAGLDLWDEWSRSSVSKYKGRDDLAASWASFGRGTGPRVTARGLRWRAMQASARGKRCLDPKHPMGTARALLDGLFCGDQGGTLLRSSGTWYEFDGIAYRTREDGAIRAQAWCFMEEAVKEGKDEALLPFKPSKAQVDSTVDALRACAHLDAVRPPIWLKGYLGPNANDTVILQNGLFHIPTRQLLQHTPGFFCVNSLPFEWSEAAVSKQWRMFLDEVFPGDVQSIETLQEVFGYFLTADTSQQKMFLLVGPKRSGKGTIGRVLTALLGRENVAGPTLSGIEKNFGLQPLIGKLAALVSDARIGGSVNKQAIVERLLMISGEDAITVDRKHIEAWTGTLSARFFFSTNEVPQLGDASGALAGRFVVLTLRETFFGREDKGLTDRLLDELPGIFRWALEGRDRLARRGYFAQPDSSLETIAALEESNSPVAAFAAEYLEMGVGFMVSQQDVFDAWRDYCRRNGSQAGPLNSFSRRFKAAFPRVGTVRPRIDGSQVLSFQGVRLSLQKFASDLV